MTDVVSPETRILLELSMLKGVGPAALKKAAGLSDLAHRGIEDFAMSVPQIERALAAEGVWIDAREKAAHQIDEARLAEAHILSPVDDAYPFLLSETRDDPFILYVKGKLSPSPLKSVAIIGTREPTQHGIVIAQRLTQYFVERGWSIVSGLAIGCDAAAHEAALAAGGHTVAVLAHGLQMVAPSVHKDLAKRILKAGGALVSEYPFGQQVQKQQYVKRDRTQAGMAKGVVMVQSDLKGGSLHASRAAIDYGRWLAVPFPTDRDRDNREPKVQANLCLANGSDRDRAELLRCRPEDLSHVLVLRSKEDYQRMLADTDEAGLVDPAASEENLDLFGTKTTASRPVEPASASLTKSEAVDPVEIKDGNDPLWNVVNPAVKYHIYLNGHDNYRLALTDTVLTAAAIWRNDDLLATLPARVELIDWLLKDVRKLAGHKGTVDHSLESRRLVFAEDLLFQMHRVVKLVADWSNQQRPGHTDDGNWLAHWSEAHPAKSTKTVICLNCLMDMTDTSVVTRGHDLGLTIKAATHGLDVDTAEISLQDVLSSFDTYVGSELTRVTKMAADVDRD